MHNEYVSRIATYIISLSLL